MTTHEFFIGSIFLESLTVEGEFPTYPFNYKKVNHDDTDDQHYQHETYYTSDSDFVDTVMSYYTPC